MLIQISIFLQYTTTPYRISRAASLLSTNRAHPYGMTNNATITDAQVHATLKKYYGYDKLRGVQSDAVRHILKNEDILVLAPTGFGKSLCFQLPALVKHDLSPERPVAVICCPLIALLQNQVSGLRAKGINCEFIASSESLAKQRDIIRRLEGEQPCDFSMVYVTAERLTMDSFLGTLSRMHKRGRLSLVAIDEAHCISQWGHDFRKAYSNLGVIKSRFPNVPVAAFTATATKTVQDHILESLKIPNAHRVQTSFLRRNIRYEVRYSDNLDSSLHEDILHFVLSKYDQTADKWQCGIVYAFKTETVDTITKLLHQSGVPVVGYHGKLSTKKRKEAQESFENGTCPVAVCSLAFGMGIDVQAVRYVIHVNLPKTLEAFYQESGRAGRDGERSDSILYYSQSDARLLKFLVRQDVKLDPARKEQMHEAIESMERYCTKIKCRRVSVLEHFDEQHTPQSACRESWGKGCDVCDNKADVRRRLHGATVSVVKSSSRSRGAEKSLTPAAEFHLARMNERMNKSDRVEDIDDYDFDDTPEVRMAKRMIQNQPSNLGFTSARDLLNERQGKSSSSRTGFRRASQINFSAGSGNSSSSGSVAASLGDLVRAERSYSGPVGRSNAKSRINRMLQRRGKRGGSGDNPASSRKKQRKMMFG